VIFDRDNPARKNGAMANPNLTPEQLKKANHLLEHVRERLKLLAGEDERLLFAYRRKLTKELGYDERGKPAHRIKLKAQKFGEQHGKCAECGGDLPEKYSVLDRKNAADGYTAANTELIHDHCDRARQVKRGYT
jgi:hypothetical protein